MTPERRASVVLEAILRVFAGASAPPLPVMPRPRRGAIYLFVYPWSTERLA